MRLILIGLDKSIMPNEKYIAFFDVDETLITAKSMFSFLKFYWMQRQKPLIGMSRYFYYRIKIMLSQFIGTKREIINKKYYLNFKDISHAELLAAGNSWWETIFSTRSVFNKFSLSELLRHQKQGAEIVLVSGSFDVCVKPIARLLNVKYCLTTELEIASGYYTGNINGLPNIGDGKKKNILQFIENFEGFSGLQNCYAYGDHLSDLPMLELVGHPCVIGSNKILLQHANKNGWKIFS